MSQYFIDALGVLGDPVDVEHGGTGRSSLTAEKIFVGNGTDPVTITGVGIDGSDNIDGVNSITYSPGSDIDVNLITVDVTGQPTFDWDESSNGFKMTKGLVLTPDGNGDLTHQINGITVSSDLEIHSQAGQDFGGLTIHRHTNNALYGGHIVNLRSNGTHDSPTIVTSGDTVSRYVSAGYDGTDYNLMAEIRGVVDGTPGANDMPGRWEFLTSPDGSNVPIEAMRLNSSQEMVLANPLGSASGGTGNSSYANGDMLIGDGGTGELVKAKLTAGEQVSLTFGAGVAQVAVPVKAKGPYVQNIGISYDSGTFTVHGDDGTALSSSNPGYVVLPDRDNLGQFIKYTVTANQDFVDDAGSSEIINNLFGLTTGVAYSSPIPFYLYPVGNNDQNAIAWMISRVPHATSSPAAANIGAPDDAVADTQGSFFSLESIDETLYDLNPCFCAGSFRMVMSASDDWTVQALDAGDGIGRFQEGREFALPTGVFGAATGSHILANGGTAPIFGTTDVKYFVNRHGHVDVYYQNVNDGGTDGAGAVTTLAVIPYLGETNLVAEYLGSGIVGTATYTAHVNAQLQSGNNVAFNRPTSATAATFIQNSDFANGNRQIRVSLRYPMKLAA